MRLLFRWHWRTGARREKYGRRDVERRWGDVEVTDPKKEKRKDRKVGGGKILPSVYVRVPAEGYVLP